MNRQQANINYTVKEYPYCERDIPSYFRMTWKERKHRASLIVDWCEQNTTGDWGICWFGFIHFAYGADAMMFKMQFGSKTHRAVHRSNVAFDKLVERKFGLKKHK